MSASSIPSILLDQVELEGSSTSILSAVPDHLSSPSQTSVSTWMEGSEKSTMLEFPTSQEHEGTEQTVEGGEGLSQVEELSEEQPHTEPPDDQPPPVSEDETKTEGEQLPQTETLSGEDTATEGEMAPSEEEAVQKEEDEGTIDTQFQLMEDEFLVSDEDSTKYITVEETVMDDLGKQITVKQKVPIIRETHRFERVTIQGDTEESKTHKFLETITKVIKQSAMNEEGELEEKEKEITEVVEHAERPSSVTIYARRANEKGEMEEVVVPPDEALPVPLPKVIVEKEEKPKKESRVKAPPQIKKILKMVPQEETPPCQPGKTIQVLKPVVEEIEVEVDDLDSDIEELDMFLDKEELTDEEQMRMTEKMQIRREARIAKLKDNLRTVLVRLALAEKKRNLYMQLISISSEVKEDILNPPDPDKPSFKVPKKVRTEDKFRRMYQEKLTEYRDLRSVILMRLATEKKRKEEVKQRYDLIGAQVAQLRKQLEEKLTGAITKLLPRNDPVFNNQSPQGMVRRVLELTERLDNETKELMYKKKQMYLAKQKYDQITENEQGLSYRYALASKELRLLLGKNDRRNEKLEALKMTMQKECLAVTHINQKCEAILKTTDEKLARLQTLNQSLNRARQDRKDVHQARRKVEAELREEKARIQLKNHPSLLKEYNLVQDLLKDKQAEFQQLRRQCLSSLQQLARSDNP